MTVLCRITLPVSRKSFIAPDSQKRAYPLRLLSTMWLCSISTRPRPGGDARLSGASFALSPDAPIPNDPGESSQLPRTTIGGASFA